MNGKMQLKVQTISTSAILSATPLLQQLNTGGRWLLKLFLMFIYDGAIIPQEFKRVERLCHFLPALINGYP
jgi:hypothetical protein